MEESKKVLQQPKTPTPRTNKFLKNVRSKVDSGYSPRKLPMATDPVSAESKKPKMSQNILYVTPTSTSVKKPPENIEEIRVKLEAEIATLKKEMAENEEASKKALALKSSDISKLLGRLEESRSARETLIKETRKYDADLQQITEGYSSALEEINTLKAEKAAQQVEMHRLIKLNLLIDKKNKHIEDLEEKCISLEEVLDKVNAEKEAQAGFQASIIQLTELKSQIHEKDQILVELEGKLAMLVANFDRVQAEKEAHAKFQAETKCIIDEKDKRIQELEVTCTHLKTSLDLYKHKEEEQAKKIEEMNSKINEKDRIIQEHNCIEKADLDKLKLECDLANNKQLKTYKAKITELEIKMSGLSEELSNFREKEKQYIANSLELKQSENKIKELNQKVSKCQKANSAIKQACQVQEEQLVDFEKLNTDQKEYIKNLETKLKEQNVSISSQRLEIEKLLQRLSSAKQEKENLEAKFKKTLNLLEQEKLDNKNQEKQHEEIVNTLEQEKQDLTLSLGAFSRGIEELETAKDTLADKMALAEYTNRKLQVESSGRLSEIIELNEKIKRITEERNGLKEQLEAIQTALDNNSEEYCKLLSDSSNEKKSLESTIKNQTEVITKLRQDLEDITKRKKTFAEKIKLI